jgi:hypothetical protein
MKSYIQIQIPGMSLAGNRGAPPGPAGADPSKRAAGWMGGRLPGPVGGDAWADSATGFLEETIPGGVVTLELDNKVDSWRIKPPAFADWQYYLPATHGKWSRGGDEITICDAANKKAYFALRQANRMSGRAFYNPSLTGRYELRTEWKRVPKPLPVSGPPPIWYGLAIVDNGRAVAGRRVAASVVLSAGQWFTFFMPAPVAGTVRGYSWTAAFVLLTSYLDRGDLAAHPGSAVDYELSLGGRWSEQAGALNQIARFKFEELIQLALKNAETLRALGMAALEGTCVDYGERQVIIGDLSGAGIGAGTYAYTGKCVQGFS